MPLWASLMLEGWAAQQRDLANLWGVDELREAEVLRAQGILHWNGPKKPWTGDGLYKVLVKKIAIILAYFANVLIFPTFRN